MIYNSLCWCISIISFPPHSYSMECINMYMVVCSYFKRTYDVDEHINWFNQERRATINIIINFVAHLFCADLVVPVFSLIVIYFPLTKKWYIILKSGTISDAWFACHIVDNCQIGVSNNLMVYGLLLCLSLLKLRWSVHGQPNCRNRQKDSLSDQRKRGNRKCTGSVTVWSRAWIRGQEVTNYP